MATPSPSSPLPGPVEEEQHLVAGSPKSAAASGGAASSFATPQQMGASPATAASVSTYNVDSSADGGNFSSQVLTLALKKFELDLLDSRHPEARELMKDPAS